MVNIVCTNMIKYHLWIIIYTRLIRVDKIYSTSLTPYQTIFIVYGGRKGIEYIKVQRNGLYKIQRIQARATGSLDIEENMFHIQQLSSIRLDSSFLDTWVQ